MPRSSRRALAARSVSRQLRLEFPGAIWHVTSRGNERRDIFRDDADRLHFVNLLARVVIDRHWILHAWVLMSNHYHLLIETPEVGLSRGVKWLNQTYAEAFNERHDRVGHLFQGRFKGILAERESHLLELIRYIVLNPVRCHAVAFAGDYEWSNYRATAGLQTAPPWLEIDWTLDQFGPDRESAHEAYRQYVADGRGASYNPREHLVGQMYLGSAAFCDRMQALVSSKERSREHPRTQRVFVRPELDAIVTRIAECFGIRAEDLRRKSRGRARKTVAFLAVDDGGLTLRAVAEWLGATAGAASKMRAAAKELWAEDDEYRVLVESIRAALS
ncbi:MAG: REP-associated tyrosine transposase [Thermoanaerobaculia bacterium]|nr:REP-associated tyrosine transposase [Thermoanaerobaculia bacterium]